MKTTIKQLLLITAVAGTLDILAAILVYAVIMDKTTAERILQSIAEGAFGKQAFAGGWEMAAAGLIFHYLIAFVFSCFYFLLFAQIHFLRKQAIVSGIFYGMVIWAVMNLLVLPLSKANVPAFNWVSVTRAAIILIICVGIPISILSKKFYEKQRQKKARDIAGLL